MPTRLPGLEMKDVHFSGIPLFSGLDRVNLAKLIPNFEELSIPQGEIVFRRGDPGESLFIIVEGIARVYLENGGEPREIARLGSGECFGEMALLTGEPRSADIQAMTELRLLKLSKTRFDQLIRLHPSLGVNVAGLLASRLTVTNGYLEGAKEGSPTIPSQTSARVATAAVRVTAQKPLVPMVLGFITRKKVWSLCAAFLICLSTGFVLNAGSLRPSHILLLEVLLGSTILWSINAFSFHTVSMALPALTVLLGITTPMHALSGFSSTIWFLMVGVFAISAAMSKTGLLYRLALLMMKRFPQNYLGQTLAIALSGAVLTPAIPFPPGRVILASPLILTLSEILGFKKGSNGAVGLSMACLLGYGQMSILFMNGSSMCFFVLGLIPQAARLSITWGSWLMGALVLGISFFLISLLGIILLYRSREEKKLNPLVLGAQLKTLGSFTVQEKVCLMTVVFSILAFMTQSWHHVNGAFIALLSFLVLLAGSVLDEKAVRGDIDWNLLLSLGFLIGFGSVISESGLMDLFAKSAKPYLESFVGSPWAFLMIIALGSFSIRFVLPFTPVLLVCMLIVLPISSPLGIHPLGKRSGT